LNIFDELARRAGRAVVRFGVNDQASVYCRPLIGYGNAKRHPDAVPTIDFEPAECSLDGDFQSVVARRSRLCRRRRWLRTDLASDKDSRGDNHHQRQRDEGRSTPARM
jgi:hypothetical protein